MKPPFIYLTPAIASSDKGSLLQAALDGNLGRLKGITPFMFSVHSGDVCVVKYFLDHGGDPTKADAKGRSVLHYAVCTGSCKITKFLLSEGIPVDIDCGNGTPLLHAASSNEDKTLKILLDHNANAGADINCKGSLVSPLLFATGQGGYTDLIPLLLKAGADPNLPDDVITMGWLPIDKEPFDRRMAIFKSKADDAFRRKNYAKACENYSLLIQGVPDATLYSNRSVCKLKMGDGKGALSDAKQSRMLRPGWAKACYRQGAAHMLLKEYKQACEAFLDAEKLDPGNEEIKRELQ
ncbi:hypothetical protein HU200_011485 [Digitaria exilis]|uniref:Serine/threonine-protein kinase BSK1-like TPR repeats domain-containing protein n=1 Tax=Digitaria exilis TaxID=1010633 RepID=A0A835FHB8_9POAL|nr:hypothetical protein HU200_011485 [Digitaria exilis]